MPFCVYDHNRVDESPLSGVRNTLRNGSVGIRGESGRNDLCPCGSGKKYKRCCGGAVGLHGARRPALLEAALGDGGGQCHALLQEKLQKSYTKATSGHILVSPKLMANLKSVRSKSSGIIACSSFHSV
ncbi:MAG: SEC-C metal-binding domain-containing protein [Candidatus Sulfotelmatobacter sp.]|jgi:hypothetical protein